MTRFRNAEVCLCRIGGVSWSNPGLETLILIVFGVLLDLLDCLLSYNASASMQPAKKIYESLLGDGVNATALAHIQVRAYISFWYLVMWSR